MTAVQYAACLLGLVLVAGLVAVEVAGFVELIRGSGRRWR